MKQPGTYIGFFQRGEIETNEKFVVFWNFFPIKKVRGNGYEGDFPYADFYRGMLELKQEPDQPGHKDRNIRIDEIEGAEEGAIHKVTFDEARFQNPGGPYISQLWLPKDCPVKDAIRVEELTLEEFLGEGTSVLIETDKLVQKSSMKAYYLDEFFCRGERSFSGGRAEEIPYSFLSEDKAVVSAGVKPKVMALFGNKPAFLPNKEITAYDAKAEGVEFIKVAIRANGWVSDWDGNRYEDVDYLQFVRIKGAEPVGTTRLIWDGKTKKCILEKSKEVKIKPVRGGGSGKGEGDGPENLIKRIHQYLTDCGRIVSEADVINYCICITQGFITTFAGAPGTGKTSLCRLLAKTLGLQEKEEIEDDVSVIPRYTEVSVERGWTSLKDFIGYPDPFTSEDADIIVPSNVDVYEAFKRMDSESRDVAGCDTLPPDLVLLDEANLSPIEYYWSQFLRNCQLDDEDELKKRKIQVSRKKAWLLSPNLRFLATVNFDHTTEELSPRFLDRTWVVTLEPPEKTDKSSRPALPASVDMATLQELFGYPREGEEFPAETRSTWDEICKAFRNEAVNLPLSPRNINAVENFCIAASRFDEITAVQALDLAVLQKILPTISGYGDRYDVLTNALLNIADENQMERTAKRLKAMRDAAEQNSGFYQFFIR